MPQDFATAKATALAVATRNGYTGSSSITITVVPGTRPSQLQVTVASAVANSFASMFGLKTTLVSRTAISDYNGPAPMGSPCNTFGNEPTNTSGCALPHGSVLPSAPVNPFCIPNPQFWATIEGPNTDKIQGDQYMTRTCSAGVYDCVGGANIDFTPVGYFFIIRVLDPATSSPINVQLHDPTMVNSGMLCESLSSTGLANNMNPYTVTDGLTRYAKSNVTY